MEISQRKFNVIVFVSILFLMAAYFVFNLFFNKGAVDVSGQVPFEFTIKGKLQVCQISPCKVKLMQGAYTLKAMKEGYREEEADFLVKRGEVSTVALNFEFIPMVRKLDAASAKNFSYDSDEIDLPDVDLGDVQSYAYGRRTGTLYFIVNETSGLDAARPVKVAQSLKSFAKTPTGKTNKTVANFMKPLAAPKVFLSEDENFVAMYDAETGEMFLINLLEDSREKILTLMDVKDIKFRPRSEKMLIGSILPGSEKLLAYGLFDLQGSELRSGLLIVAEPGSIVWRDGNNILYAVEREYSPRSSGLAEILEKGGGLKVVTDRNSFMVNYNFGFDRYSNLYEPKTFVRKVKIDENSTVTFGDGDNVWEIKFSEG